jgi:hypothetical protein
LGDAHRKNWRDFFEYCLLNSNTSIAKEDECLILFPETTEVFNEIVMPSKMIECEYCPALAQMKCNVCLQGYTCQKDVGKWKTEHVCKIKSKSK